MTKALGEYSFLILDGSWFRRFCSSHSSLQPLLAGPHLLFLEFLDSSGNAIAHLEVLEFRCDVRHDDL